MEVVGDHAARLRKAPVEVASAMLTAIADGRAEDAAALADPQVIWVPSIRPGRTLYEGRTGWRCSSRTCTRRTGGSGSWCTTSLKGMARSTYVNINKRSASGRTAARRGTGLVGLK